MNFAQFLSNTFGAHPILTTLLFPKLTILYAIASGDVVWGLGATIVYLTFGILQIFLEQMNKD